ncbi:MAG: hypothetical protein HQ578_00520 [Chloroflexi bacterium]|nr:hypothetical protein [Chloroflexota bacterium]
MKVDDEEREDEATGGEEEASEEAEPVTEQTPEPAPEPAPPAEESKPRQPTDEIKVVVVLKADKILVGVQSPDCDPVYKTFQGDMAIALKKVPGLIKEANQQWDARPRYPKADLPEPAPTTSTTARTPKAVETPKSQPSFF